MRWRSKAVLCMCVCAIAAPASARADDVARQASCAALAGGTVGGPDVPGTSGVPDLGDADLYPLAPPGLLPDRVWVRSTTDTMNRRWYFAARGGRVYFKPNAERTGTDGPWRELSLPACFAGDVQAISTDDDEMLAVDSQRRVYTMDSALSDPVLFDWTSRWGPVFWTGPGRTLPTGVLAWSWAVLSPSEDRTWTDSAGTEHAVGGAKVSHIYMLRDGGQHITYADPWLPNDESYEVCGPLRGRLRSVGLSAAASTVFVTDRFGDMYTRLYDFDMSGADTVYFHYTYGDPASDTGNTATGGAAIHLPASGWVRQPKIPGRITDAIGVFSDGPGSDHRRLRVEGIDGRGRHGFWEKEIAEPSWRFVPTGAALRGHLLSNPAADSSARALGPAEDLRYSGSREDASVEVADFNPYCSPARLRLSFGRGAVADLILHSVDGLRQTPLGRGLDGDPRRYDGMIEVPPGQSRDPRVRTFLENELGGRRFTPTDVQATERTLTIDSLHVTLHRAPPESRRAPTLRHRRRITRHHRRT